MNATVHRHHYVRIIVRKLGQISQPDGDPVKP